MDLTIPYTFYPVALPHWMGGLCFWSRWRVESPPVSLAVERGWVSGVRAGLVGGVAFLLVTMVASMVITFFVHDL
jgi:hypothetical protein